MEGINVVVCLQCWVEMCGYLHFEYILTELICATGIGTLILLTEGTCIFVHKQVTEGKIEVGIKVKGRRERSSKQLLDDFAVCGELAFEEALGLSYDRQQNKCVYIYIYIYIYVCVCVCVCVCVKCRPALVFRHLVYRVFR